MFHLTNDIILKKCTPLILNRGKDYYRSKKIRSITFSQDRLLFDAVVLGTKKYDVQVQFNDDGEIIYESCSCSAFDSYVGICRHVAAVLLAIRDKDEQGFFNELKSRRASEQIFNFFENRPAVFRVPLELEVTYEFHKGRISGSWSYSGIRMRMGEDRLYVVKDIKALMQSLEAGQPLEFGRSFVLEPSRHGFKPEDQPLIDMIEELYQTEQLVDEVSPGSGKNSVFRDRQMLLAPVMAKRFLNIMEGRTFKAVIDNRSYEEIRIINEDFPVQFTVTREGNNLQLQMEHEEPLIPLTGDGEYFLCGDLIYKVSQKQRDSFKPFYMAMLRNQSSTIQFFEEDKSRFVSEILPFAEKAGKVDIDEKAELIIEKYALEPEIYLDRQGDIITADVRFNYGNTCINPFSPAERAAAPEGRIIARDMEKERLLMDILGETGFRVSNGLIHMDQEENVFNFIHEIVPRLQEHAQVFYSDSFRKTVIRETAFFSGDLRFNTATGMLEFSFSIEGIDRSELVKALEMAHFKKKYYRLKDGTYLPLDSREMRDLGGLAEYLDLDEQDLMQDTVQIPAYRALYLDQLLKGAGLNYIETNNDYKAFVKRLQEPADIDMAIPSGLNGTLREYQKSGFRWLRTMSDCRLGCILADDMGLGKTIQVITLILSDKWQKGTHPSLVVVPTSLVYNWLAELEKFAPDLKAAIVSGTREERRKQLEDIKDSDVVITSYALIRRDIEEYLDIDFRYCILDEAQHIKNPGSQSARSVKRIRAENRIALTGTPMENSLVELWSVFDFIIPGYLFSHTKFLDKYGRPIIKEEDAGAKEELARHIRPFILRRLKKDVLKELPEKVEHRMIADLTPEQKKLYLAYLSRIKEEINEDIREHGFERNQIRILAALTRLRQICCHPSLFIENYVGESGKLMLLQEVINDSIQSGHRILLFSQFTSMLHIIRDWLLKENIGHLYLDGSTRSEDRTRLVSEFNEGEGSIFLISLKAGGTGLNLTGADVVIHYDPWWNPAVEDQATDRAYRIGQLKSVHVIKLVTRGTIEEKIFALQEKKKQLIDSVIQPGENLLSKMTEEEIKGLFEL